MSLEGKKIVITGASGFLGRNLAARLSREGAQITALSARWTQMGESLPLPGVCWRDKNAFRTDPEVLARALVVNGAYPRNTTGADMADGLGYIADVLSAAAENGARGVVNISSQSVYSQSREGAAAEDTPLCLESAYAVGKYACELLTEKVCASRGVAFTSVRLSSLVGPGFDQRVLNKMIRSGLRTGSITVGDNPARYGYLDVADACEGLLALLRLDPEAWSPVYNLGSGGTWTLEDMGRAAARAVEEYTGRPVELRREDTGRSYPPFNSRVDPGRMERELGFRAKRSLEDTVRSILAYETAQAGRE